jgi:hypothetical protein
MAFFQLPSPDLSNLSLGGSVLRLLEAYGFTADEQDVVVRATYTDDGDPSFGLHYGVWLFDIDSREYGVNFNELIAGENNAREIDVLQIQTSGTSENLFAIALVETKATGGARLVSLSNNEIVSNNLIHTVYGEELDIKIEDFLLSEDGRFLAIQTSSEQLAAENAPDTNDSSDIYLADLHNNSITRISYVGDSEVTDPTYLKDIDINGNLVKVAFTTDAAFVSPSKIDINSTGISTQANSRSDAYIWSSEFNDNGLSSSFSFELVSMDYEGKASGFIDRENSVQITDTGAVFTSSAENIVEADYNESEDAFFISTNGQVERLVFEPSNELDYGSVFLSASENGRFLSYLSSSPELSGVDGAQQVILYDRQKNETEVISQNGNLANNWVTSGTISASGYSHAFTSSADNLTSEPLAANAGGLFLSLSDSTPISGHVYHWKSHELMQDVFFKLSDYTDDVANELTTTTSDIIGEYTLLSDNMGDKLVAPSLEIALSQSRGVITSADAVAALRIAIGLNPNVNESVPISPYQIIAADVDKNGKVSSLDALHLIKLAVRFPDAIPPEWLFVKENEDFWDESSGGDGQANLKISNRDISWDSIGLEFTDSQNINANFVGLMLGDVNGSWSSNNSTILPESYFKQLEDDDVGPASQWHIDFIA